jgi:hypothetical protein
MFLGLEAPSPATQEGDDDDDDDDDDPEIRRAREAALYAEGMLLEESTKRKQTQGRGPLGFGFLPKAHGLFSSIQTTTTTTQDTNPRPPSPRCDIHVDDVVLGPATDDDRPPWFSTTTAHQNNSQTSDYGISGSSSGRGDSGSSGPPPKKSAAVMGASVVGGVAGLLVLGPLAGVAAAGGVAYAAATKEGGIGNVIRSTGGLVAKAGSAAKRFEDEHGVVSKTASGVAKGVGWIAKQTTQGSKDP